MDMRRRIIKHRKLKRKYLYRRMAVGVAVATIIAAIATTIGYAVNTTSADTVYSTYTYTVQPGDTLWSIAYKNVGEQKDVRREIYDIKFDNDINEHVRDIHPGDVLILKKPIN